MNKIEISNPDRIIYKKDKITKLDVINYYNSIAKYMFPFLDKRLLSVIRCHGDTTGDKFFKKHPTVDSKFIGKFKDGSEEYFYLKNIAGIIEQVQLGTIEFHTWASQISAIDKPNLMVFDLDPDEKMDLKQLRQGVLHLKSILDELKLKSYLKTSGGKGYHIVVPFSKSKNWEKFDKVAEQIAKVMEQKWPNLYTTNSRKIQRKGKIFVDYLRNSRGATCVAPFSLRARETPTVSMPISFKDLNKYSPNYFTMFNAKKFIKTHTPWQNFSAEKQKLD